MAETIKTTYGQQWKEYNEAQTKEKLIFYKLLNELLNVVPIRKQLVFGRPRKSLRDMIFCCLIKIYTNTSSRRSVSDFELAKQAGYIQEVPHFNTLLNYFDDYGMRIVLEYLITLSAMPLKCVESTFAMDATGFGSHRFDRWMDAKYKLPQGMQMKYVKAHVTCGVKTNIITAVRVTAGNVNDTTQFGTLLTETANNFNITEICADKGYLSRANMNLADELHIMPYIPFKCNVTKGSSRGSPMWSKMFKQFTENYEEFAQHYHKRSNVESTFAMIKKKFGDFCRCKSERSLVNEVLCKILAHNLTCLIHEIFELKIDVDFAQEVKMIFAQLEV